MSQVNMSFCGISDSTTSEYQSKRNLLSLQPQ